jgi:hypothetical protein
MFCKVNGAVKEAITRYLVVNGIDYAPLFAQVTGRAEKNLSADSISPTLRVDSTFLPFSTRPKSSILLCISSTGHWLIVTF